MKRGIIPENYEIINISGFQAAISAELVLRLHTLPNDRKPPFDLRSKS
jgi:hypothetical protein